jgi:hypothetical protein
MDRLIAANTVSVGLGDIAPLTGTPGQASSGVPGISNATTFPPYAWNMLTEEMRAVVVAAGITPDGTNWGQLLLALQTLGGGFRHTAVYMIVAGVQKVSIDGAAFTTTGATTFPAPPSGFARSRVWGSGGSAGGAKFNVTAGASSGGSGGGYAEKILRGLTTSTAITVGPGPAGGTGTPTDGTTGATSSVGAFVSATGGGPGFGANGTQQGTTSAGGVGVGGDVNIPGTSGSGALSASTGGAGGNAFGGLGGPGGSTGGSGSAGGTPGGGGAGTGAPSGGQAGGKAGDGMVILEY